MKQLNEVARMQQLAGINEITINNPFKPKLKKVYPNDPEDNELILLINGRKIEGYLDYNNDDEYIIDNNSLTQGVSIYYDEDDELLDFITEYIDNKYIIGNFGDWIHIKVKAFTIIDNINEIIINKPGKVILKDGEFYDFKYKFQDNPEGTINVQNPRDQNKFTIENGILWYNGHEFLGKSNDNDLYFFKDPSYRPDRYYITKEKMDIILQNQDIRKGKNPFQI